ncbi:MAG: hypothetical protein ACO307_15000, partial [Ilumatobacteraceae bacterium]
MSGVRRFRDVRGFRSGGETESSAHVALPDAVRVDTAADLEPGIELGIAAADHRWIGVEVLGQIVPTSGFEHELVELPEQRRQDVVGRPDIASPDEARQYVTELRQILVAIGASDAKMEEGSM